MTLLSNAIRQAERGAHVFCLAFLIYVLTLSPGATLWDACEFVTSAARLDVGHPPGAPLYWLVLRLFVLLFPSGCEALACNVASALSVALAATVLCLVVREMLLWLLPSLKRGAVLAGQTAAGLSWAVADSVWGVAVEAEVYGAACLLGFSVLYLALLWRRTLRGRYLALGALVMGLMAGVHWIGWLLLPVVGAVVGSYFDCEGARGLWRRRRGLLLGSGVGILVLGVMALLAGGLYYDFAVLVDLFFVNIVGLPVGVGLVVGVFLPSALLLIYLLTVRSVRRQCVSLYIFLLSIGFISPLVPFLRANSGVAIAVSSPADAQTFADYVARKQYGDRPILFGPSYASSATGIRTEPRMIYDDEQKKYVPKEVPIGYDYPMSEKIFFPRMTMSDDASLWAYLSWARPEEIPDGQPTLAENTTFFLRYQMGHMMLRYVFWNLCGRQNDHQGDGGYEDGNFITGFHALDNARLHMEEYDARTEGRYELFCIPLLLVFAGFFFLFKRWRVRFMYIVGLWLLVTGPVLALYLNVPPFEPRERDYVFLLLLAGLFVLLGVGVACIAEKVGNRVVAAIVGLSVPVLMTAEGFAVHDRSGDTFVDGMGEMLLSLCPPNSVLVVGGDNDTYPLWYAQEVRGLRRDVRIVNYTLLSSPWYAKTLHEAQPGARPLTLSHDKLAAQGKLGAVALIPSEKKDTLDLSDMTPLAQTATGNYYLLRSKNLWLPLKDSDYCITLSANELDPSALLLLEIATMNPDRPLCTLPNVLPEELGLQPLLRNLGPIAYLEGDTILPPQRRWNLFQALNALPSADNYSMTTTEQNILQRLKIRELCNKVAKEALSTHDNEAARQALRRSLVIMPSSAAPIDDALIEAAQLMQQAEMQHLVRPVLADVANACTLKLRRAKAKAPYAPGAAQAEVEVLMPIVRHLMEALVETGNRDMAVALGDYVNGM